MDIFTQKRFTVSVIVVLVVLNVATMALLWLREARRPWPPPLTARAPHDEPRSISMLRNELGLTDEQLEMYLELRKQHRRDADRIRSEMHALKKQMFDHLFESEPDTVEVERIIRVLAEKEKALERATFAHLRDLRDLCGEGQQEKLRNLLDEFFRATGTAPGGSAERHPPGAEPRERR